MDRTFRFLSRFKLMIHAVPPSLPHSLPGDLSYACAHCYATATATGERTDRQTDRWTTGTDRQTDRHPCQTPLCLPTYPTLPSFLPVNLSKFPPLPISPSFPLHNKPPDLPHRRMQGAAKQKIKTNQTPPKLPPSVYFSPKSVCHGGHIITTQIDASS